MKTYLPTRLPISAAALVAACISGSAHSQTVKLMDYFYPMKEGATWSYHWTEGRDQATEQLTLVDSDWSVTLYTGKNSPKPYRKEALRFKFERQYDGGGKDQWYDYYGNGTSYSRYGSDDDNDQIRVDGGFVFPVSASVGKTYSPSADFYDSGKYQGALTYSLQLLDALPATVTAGEFSDCIHLLFQMKQGSKVLWTEEMWWAKGLGIIKERKTEDGTTSTRELISSTIKNGPEISVEQAKSANLVDGKTKSNFGSMPIGKSSSSKTFTIKNTGTSSLTSLAIQKSGSDSKDFIVTAIGKKSVDPGESTTFKVTFKPSAKGTRKATIRIKSNDADENPFDINLTGMGVK
jgi:Abnormal spindle-like microcephaly-assoc'd, ASPM-SPD-2-Hydin